eukprot:Skav217093  [mRNA]  locus=scaffold187:65028:66099:- [translate_table: standard]
MRLKTSAMAVLLEIMQQARMTLAKSPLVVDATLEASRAPIHELNGTLGLDHLRASSVHHAAGHVFAMARIAFHHHRCWLEDTHGDLSHGKLLMVGLLR